MLAVLALTGGLQIAESAANILPWPSGPSAVVAAAAADNNAWTAFGCKGPAGGLLFLSNTSALFPVLSSSVPVDLVAPPSQLLPADSLDDGLLAVFSTPFTVAPALQPIRIVTVPGAAPGSAVFSAQTVSDPVSLAPYLPAATAVRCRRLRRQSAINAGGAGIVLLCGQLVVNGDGSGMLRLVAVNASFAAAAAVGGSSGPLLLGAASVNIPVSTPAVLPADAQLIDMKPLGSGDGSFVVALLSFANGTVGPVPAFKDGDPELDPTAPRPLPLAAIAAMPSPARLVRLQLAWTSAGRLSSASLVDSLAMDPGCIGLAIDTAIREDGNNPNTTVLVTATVTSAGAASGAFNIAVLQTAADAAVPMVYLSNAGIGESQLTDHLRVWVTTTVTDLQLSNGVAVAGNATATVVGLSVACSGSAGIDGGCDSNGGFGMQRIVYSVPGIWDGVRAFPDMQWSFFPPGPAAMLEQSWAHDISLPWLRSHMPMWVFPGANNGDSAGALLLRSNVRTRMPLISSILG